MDPFADDLGWDPEPTRVASIDLPKEAFPESAPLAYDSGISGEGWDDEPSTRVGPIHLPPEAYRDPPPPLVSDDIPMAASDDFSFDDPAPSDEAIPLPGNSASPPSFDFDFGSPPEEAPAAIPLPGSAATPASDDLDFSDFGNAPGEAIPLPGGYDAAPAPTPAEDDFGFDFGAPAEPPPAPADDYSAFEDLPAPVDEATRVTSAPPPAAAVPIDDFSFDDFGPPADTAAPAPAAQYGSDFSFEDLPSPAPATGFDNLPAPADPYAQAPTPAPAAPPPVDLSASFGEVDFGAPSSGGGSLFDDLEFDPTKDSRKVDEFEADLSAPLPPPSAPPPADGLEMLSFIEDTARDANAFASQKALRFHIRRRSGKVFGPFEEGVIVKMLEDGQLLGNEDVSTDGDTWAAIGSVGPFGAVIQRLVEVPVAGGIAAAAESLSSPPRSAEAMERLRQVYEGRMAAVSVVDRRSESATKRLKLPLFIALGLVLVVGLAGGALGFTRYGYFGLKYLMPAKVAPGSPQFTQLKKAGDALLADTWKSYSEAREIAQGILKAKEYPEARAVWAQAVFYLDRRYAAAKPAELSRANSELENIQLIGEKHPEVVKALAGAALSARKPDEARLLLEDAVIRHGNDPELKLLLAEAFVARGQDDRALQTLEKVLAADEQSAKALHAIGMLRQRKAEKLRNAGQREEAQKEAELAATSFASALKADPEHVISAVELAAIELLVARDPEGGAAALERALDEKSRSLLGPAELARARALNGAALAMKFKPKEAIAEFEEALKLDKDSIFAKAQLGNIYLAQRDFERAMPLFQEASAKEPSNLEYVDGHLTALVGYGKMQDALEFLKKANAQFPDTPRLAYLEGRVNDALDVRDEAEKHYQRAVAGDASLFEANLHLGRLYLRQKRIVDARAQFEAALEKAPENALVHSGMGELAFADGGLEAARISFQKAASLDPTLADAQNGLSRVALAENRVEDAARYVARALELDPRLKNGLLQQGLVLWRQGKLDEAIAALEEGRKLEPTNAQISITLGAVQLDKGELAAAETALLSALTVEPRSGEAHFYRARVKNRRAEHAQAIDAMKAALEAAPKKPEYHYEMGVVLRDARKVTEAMDAWRRALEFDPGYADAMEALGQALLDRGEFEEAIEQFEAALKVDPSRARLLGMIGDAWFQATQWDRAIVRYQAALKSDPKLTYVFYKIGRALSESGEPGQAIDWYRRATLNEPENAMPWYYLGYLYKEKNQRRDAIGAFKAYLSRRPDAPDRQEIELEIYDLEQGI